MSQEAMFTCSYATLLFKTYCEKVLKTPSREGAPTVKRAASNGVQRQTI